jgi:long-chain fatty acid transport protein
MRRKAVLTAAAFLAAIGLSATRANAQGYSVYEHDACAMGRAGAGVASPCAGGSAIFFNPAGIVTGERDKWNVSFGVTMIPPRGSFVPDAGTSVELVKNNIPVPNIYITRQIGTRWALGVGMFAPYGLTTEWPTTSPGRFLSYKATIQAIYMQPTIAFRLSPRIQLGAGFDVVRSGVDLHQRVDLSSQLVPGAGGATFGSLPQTSVPLGTDFADTRLHGTGTAYAAHFGIIVRPTDALSLGLRYMTGTTVKGSGYAAFSQVATGLRLLGPLSASLPTGTPIDAIVAGQFGTGGRLVTQTVDASIPMPAQLVAGFNYRVTSSLSVMADVQLTNWSAFKQLELTLGVIGPDTLYEDYSNTTGFRAAVEYAVTPKLNVRGGFLAHGGAAPDHTVTPLLPEAARTEFVLGAGYQLNSGIRIDAAYQIINQKDRRGRVVDWKPGDGDLNSGVYKFSANLLGVGVAFAF